VIVFRRGLHGGGLRHLFPGLYQGDRDGSVEVRLLHGEGIKTVSLAVPARSRCTLRADDVLPGREFSCAISSDVPVVEAQSGSHLVVEEALNYRFAGEVGGGSC
jgi:hypothetical protein